ncbi:phosphatidate cytidylyltransferase [Microbacterium indicum]|uniref:phosphatidate cytidylyltransferase n=1 Tax=Microbacterium indicum TaxID=358100 RepID=UPI00048BECB1|nr:phosphatidate cytidylyltransferase [Microbacterium indicum]
MTAESAEGPVPEDPAADPARPAHVSLHDRVSGARGDLEQRAQQARDQLEQKVEHARDQFEATNERIKKRTGRDLFAAIGVGVVAGLGLLAALLFAKVVFVIAAVIIAGAAVVELSAALRARGRRIDLAPQLIGTAAIMIAAYWFAMPVVWTALFFALALIIVWRVLSQMMARDGRVYASIFSDIVVGCFVPIYIPLLASAALMLARGDGGEWWVLGFLIVVVVSDTSAYASGLLFGRGGRHKLAPSISPGKTWEGFYGALAMGAVAGVLVAIFLLGLPWWSGIVFGVVLVGAATLGDLGESMIKRDLGVKDMSSILPGHGGILDRLDSILPSAAVALVLFFFLGPLAS